MTAPDDDMPPPVSAEVLVAYDGNEPQSLYTLACDAGWSGLGDLAAGLERLACAVRRAQRARMGGEST